MSIIWIPSSYQGYQGQRYNLLVCATIKDEKSNFNFKTVNDLDVINTETKYYCSIISERNLKK